jgi:hypothetical protein
MGVEETGELRRTGDSEFQLSGPRHYQANRMPGDTNGPQLKVVAGVWVTRTRALRGDTIGLRGSGAGVTLWAALAKLTK